MRETTVLFIS